ncbi:MAG: mannonate dehydratase [Chloroflexota bacterium]
MLDLTTLPMRAAIGQFNELTDEQIAFALQCGVQDVLLNTPLLPGDERWEFKDLLKLRMRAEERGLRVICLENVPIKFYDQIMIGAEGRERQLVNMQETVRNMGRAGIPILGYHWMPNSVWRTGWDTPVRGGATSNSFDLELAKNAPLSHGRVYSDEEMWATYDWYMERMLPVCEEFGVRMALHPDDPPVPSLGGVARLFRNFENFQRALDTHDSPMHGLDFCHGCWSEMRGGAGVLDAIEHFGARGKIFYMHLRDVRGTAEHFTECFINEGNSNPFAVVRKLKAVGFNGFIIDDHVPHMVNDSPWGHRGRAFATGHISALLDVVNTLDH